MDNATTYRNFDVDVLEAVVAKRPGVHAVNVLATCRAEGDVTVTSLEFAATDAIDRAWEMTRFENTAVEVAAFYLAEKLAHEAFAMSRAN